MKVIGIAGFARCGKDTFVGIAKNILLRNGYRPQRFAFADMLKNETEEMLKSNKFSATVYTEESGAKNLIRPLLVWWGCQRRYESEGGLYWVNEVDKKLKNWDECEARGGHIGSGVALVSDVRFVNEAKWVHENWKGVVIHLKRWSTKEVRDGYGDTVFAKTYDPAPNEEEAKNDPLVQELADHRIEWESKGKHTAQTAIEDPYLQSVVLEALNATKFFKHSTSGTLS